MTWTQEHNEMLIEEIYHYEPYKYKHGSKYRGNAWEMISESLNSIEKPKFSVNQKSVRDHYNLLDKEHRKRIKEEEKASGISPEHTELEEHMQDLIERFDAKDSEDQLADEEKKEKSEAETAKAEEMRRMSMETMAQSRKRKGDEQKETKKKRRVAESDTVSFLREKAVIDAELKKEELKIREEEAKNQRLMQEQMIQQMQSQNAAIMALIQGMSKDVSK